jgi:hypothetical protein
VALSGIGIIILTWEYFGAGIFHLSGGGKTINNFILSILFAAVLVVAIVLEMKYRESNRKAIQEKVDSNFREHVSKMPFHLQRLREVLGQDASKLDYTKESLKFVDALISERIKKESDYRSTRKILLVGEEGFMVARLSYYVADFLIKNFGMRWVVDDEGDSLDYRRPILVLDNTEFRINPLRLIFESGRNGTSVYDWYTQVEEKYGDFRVRIPKVIRK